MRGGMGVLGVGRGFRTGCIAVGKGRNDDRVYFMTVIMITFDDDDLV